MPFHETRPKPNLHEAWTVLHDEGIRFDTPELQAAFAVVLDTAERLIVLFNDHQLGSDVEATSGSDDAAALYELLNAAGLECL